MLRFHEFINSMLNEGINKQLVVAQMSKKWKMERVPDDEIEKRLQNSSSDVNINSIVDLISQADPTPNKEFFGWILTQYVNDKIRLPEDAPILHQDLGFFTNVKRSGALKRVAASLSVQLSIKNPLDITSYDRYKLQELVDAVRKLSGEDLESNRQKISKTKQEGANQVYKDEEWEIIEVESPEAACFYAKGTRWCTSNKSTASYYLGKGSLYIIYHEGEPYGQLHLQSKQFMNPADKTIKNAPNELGEIMLDNIDMKNGDKLWFVRHFEKDGSVYRNYFALVEEELDKIEKEFKYNHMVPHYYFSDDIDDEELRLSAEISIRIPIKKIVDKSIFNWNWEKKKSICKDTNFGCEGFEIFKDKNDVVFVFAIDRESSFTGTNPIEEWRSFLRDIAKEDKNYNRHKNEVYNVLSDLGIINPSIEPEHLDEIFDTKFDYFELDGDEYDKEGVLLFQTGKIELATFEDLGIHDWDDNYYSSYSDEPNHVKFRNKLNMINEKEIANLFEKVINKKLLSKLRNHRSQGVLPGFTNTSKPDSHFNNRVLPKVSTSFSKINKDIYISVTLEYHIHDAHDSQVVNDVFKKMKMLDKHFPEMLYEARKFLIKSFKWNEE